MSTYHYIAQRRAQVPVRQLCQVLQVAPNAYYAWHRKQGRLAPEPVWQAAVHQAFAYHSQRYGTRQLRAEVQADGHAVGASAACSTPTGYAPSGYDPAAPLVCAPHDRFRPGRARGPNRLLGQPAPIAPNQVWVGDITYLPRQGGGWLYLGVWLDRCSRKIVGWDLRETIPEDLVSEALRRALVLRQPSAGLIEHSDQGNQYTATRFKDLLARNGAVQSMSRRGNCYDNALPDTAHAESFWSRFNNELLDGGSFPGLAEAKLEISHNVAYYNAERRHSTLGYHSPNYFETHF